MYIKQIMIENFKSYSGRHVISNLDPDCNIFVGSNGSGKSTLLDAIAFVLTSKYSQLTGSIRKKLIFDHSSRAEESPNFAIIEIILNNEDKKLPHEDNEVRIRRIIDNSKKDVITINKRVCSQSQLQDFLQPAFPPDNPYYIVEQNQIARLALASDEKRFHMFRITIGCDEISQDLDTLIKDLMMKKRKMIDQRASLRKHHGRLNANEEKLNKWQRIDAVKRLLQERVERIKMDDAWVKVRQIREYIQQEEERLQSLKADYEEKDVEYKNMKQYELERQKSLDNLKEMVATYKEKRLTLKTNIQNLMNEQKILNEKIHQRQRPDEDERIELNAKITDIEHEKQTIEKQFKDTFDSLKTRQRELFEINKRKEELIFRKSMDVSAIDAEEIEADLSKLEEVVQSQEKYLSSQERIVKDLHEKIEEKEGLLHDMKIQLQELKDKVQEKREINKTIKEKRNKRLEQRKKIQMEADVIKQEINKEKAELAKVDKTFRKLVRKQYVQGIDSMQQIIKTWTNEGRNDDVEGIKGALVDNFTCEKTIQPLTEIIAGNLLFYYIVRDRELANKVLEEMKEQRLPGLVSCIPIANIKVNNMALPTGNDCLSLLTQVKTDSPEAEKAAKFVFGKTMIPRDMTTGTRLIKEYPSLNFITLQRQQILKPGMFKGGYKDDSASSINLYKQRNQLKESINETEEELKNVQDEIKQADTEIDNEISQLQKNEAAIDRDEKSIKKLEHQIKLETELLKQFKKSYENNQNNLDTSRMKRDCARRFINFRGTNEASLNFDASVIDEELERLRNSSRDLENSIRQDEGQLSQYQKKLQSNEKIMNCLQERDEELKATSEEESSREQLQSALEVNVTNIKTYEAELNVIYGNLDNLQPQIDELDKTLRQMTMSNNQLKLNKEKAEIEWTGCRNYIAGLNEKNKAIQHEILKSEEEIINLGPILFNDDHESYENLSKKELIKKIQKLKKKEEELGAINKNLTEHMGKVDNYLEILENLISRVDKLTDDFVKMLNHVADVQLETLDFCFKRFNRYCQEIFKKIVPTGDASLEPVWNGENEANNDDNAIPWNKVDRICLKATFSQEESMKNFLSFSGGQKTISALVFIFALQKLKPAPFYLFDEIDSVLDERYRQSVSEIIQEMARNSQVFIITFRKELLNNEGQFFKVETQRGRSRIGPCTRDEAEQGVAREN